MTDKIKLHNKILWIYGRYYFLLSVWLVAPSPTIFLSSLQVEDLTLNQLHALNSEPYVPLTWFVLMCPIHLLAKYPFYYTFSCSVSSLWVGGGGILKPLALEGRERDTGKQINCKPQVLM